MQEREREAAETEMKDAKREMEDAETEMKDAETEMKAAETKMNEARSNLEKIEAEQDSLQKQLVRLKSQSDSIQFITNGKIQANDAQVSYKLGELEKSNNSANLAVSYLTDSIPSSAEIQVLYDVYTDLLYEDATIFNNKFRETERKWDVPWKGQQPLEAILKDSVGLRDKHPIMRDSLLNGDIYKFMNWDDQDLTKLDLNKYVTDHKDIDEKEVTALSLNPCGKWLAVGFKSGKVELWNWNSGVPCGTEPIEKFVKHSHRITSIAFSPESDKIVMASIDEGFSIFSLQTECNIDERTQVTCGDERTELICRDKRTEVIYIDNGIRPRDVFFWNEDVLVTIGWKSFAKPWATNVLKLKEIKDNN